MAPPAAVPDDGAVPGYRNTSLSAEARAADLVRRLSLEEKAAQMRDNAPAVPRLGIPAYQWWNEGLHGLARNGYATVFPQATGLAASWNPDLLHQVGETISAEARAGFARIDPAQGYPRYAGLTLWSPNINILRDPRWGRGQETYGEDPFLTSRLGVAFVRGLQGDDPQHPRTIATPKHFAAHSGPEPGRDSFDVAPSAHDLEDTYLPAFRAAVAEGGAGSVMCAYNALAGIPACANADLLQRHLREDWGFSGYVVSDCDAVGNMTQFHHYTQDAAEASARAVLAGNDLNCGSAYLHLADAVRRGLLPQADLDRSLQRLLAARIRLGMYEPAPARPVDTQATRTLALDAARESLVLLKNARNTLPLRAGARIAAVGPTADLLEVLQANYHGTARDPVTPWAGLRQRFGADKVHYAQGASLAANVPIAIPSTALRTPDGQPGLKGEYFDNAELAGNPARVRVDRTVNFDFNRVAPAPGIRADRYGVRWTGRLQPPAPGRYRFNVRVDRCFDCSGHDRVDLYLDGRLLYDGTQNAEAMTVDFQDTQPHELRLELRHSGEDEGITLEWLAPPQAQLDEALAAAREADAIVAFVGLSPNLEGEALQVEVAGFNGGDRTSLDLPAAQETLLKTVAATGKPLVVVLLSGSAVALNWAQQHADAILVAWYPGEAGGQAVADVLAGAYNPAGRLPMTFYRSADDLPPMADYRMQGRTYRYFNGKPLYPFGHGLSYTRFGYDGMRLSQAQLKAGEPLTVSVEVRNLGDRDGDEVVQAYLTPPASPLAPRHALAGFRRVHLKAGESRRVEIELSPRALSTVDAQGRRAVRAGRYTLSIGGGQPGFADVHNATFAIEGEQALPR
nr:glycoside hydrolase family 3 C-terminal domain-containing protein [Pseudoxanthomonas helianthi]